MTDDHIIQPKIEKNPLELNGHDEAALYEYAFPTTDFCFEVVKVEDKDYDFSEPEAKEFVLPTAAHETETDSAPIRRSQRTPKRKVMKDFEFTTNNRLTNGLDRKHISQKERSTKPKLLQPEKNAFVSNGDADLEIKISNVCSLHEMSLIHQPKTAEKNKPTITLNQIKNSPPKYIQLQKKRPPVSIRFDKMDHFPEIETKLRFCNRCKFEGCRGRSRVYCVKCMVTLCLTRGRNCFRKFHDPHHGVKSNTNFF